MNKTISIINYKGGVGKSVVALNLGAALQRQGKRILLIDLDSQAALTFALLGRESVNVESSVFNFLMGDKPVDIIEIDKDLELIPSTFELDSFEKKRIEEKDSLLKDLLRDVKGYDFILIDTPPAINIFTVMAILAARSVYVIVNADFLSYRSLLAIEDVIKSLKVKIKKRVLINLFDWRRNIEKDLFKKLKEVYQDNIFKTPIRRSVMIPESVFLSKDIFRYRKKSPVAKDFQALAKEVIKKESEK